MPKKKLCRKLLRPAIESTLYQNPSHTQTDFKNFSFTRFFFNPTVA